MFEPNFSSQGDHTDDASVKNENFNVATLRKILVHNGFELFHSLCYCNAWRTVDQLGVIFDGRFDGFPSQQIDNSDTNTESVSFLNC